MIGDPVELGVQDLAVNLQKEEIMVDQAIMENMTMMKEEGRETNGEMHQKLNNKMIIVVLTQKIV